MHKLLMIAAVVALAGCSQETSPPADDSNVASVDDLAARATPTATRASAASMSLLNTTWEFSDEGAPTVITIDRGGGYIENRGDGTHVDHGKYAQKDGKDCFTSAMGDMGTRCWTTVPEVEIGATASARSDDGQSAVFKRVNYRELSLLPG